MRIKEMITKGELRPVLKQFLPTSTVRNALGQIKRICMLILGSKGLNRDVDCMAEKFTKISRRKGSTRVKTYNAYHNMMSRS